MFNFVLIIFIKLIFIKKKDYKRIIRYIYTFLAKNNMIQVDKKPRKKIFHRSRIKSSPDRMKL